MTSRGRSVLVCWEFCPAWTTENVPTSLKWPRVDISERALARKNHGLWVLGETRHDPL